MARNLKKEYIKKLIETTAPNNFKFDLQNYLYNPSFDNDYPSFMRTISEAETEIIKERIYYFKYYNGGGEYLKEVYTVQKNGEQWQVVKNRSEISLEKSKRFSLNRLLALCSGV